MSSNAKTIVISNIATTPRASLEPTDATDATDATGSGAPIADMTVRVAISKVKGESL